MTAELIPHPMLQAQIQRSHGAVVWFSSMADEYARAGLLGEATSLRDHAEQARVRLAELQRRCQSIRIPACPA